MYKNYYLELIHKKISEGFGTYFLSQKEFEKQLSEQQDKIIEFLSWLIKRHDDKIELMKPWQKNDFSLVSYLYGIRPKRITPNKKESAIKHFFWQYFNNYIDQNHYKEFIETEIRNSPEKIINKFKEYYLSNTYLLLFNVAEKYILDEKITGLDKVIVNVGKRSIELSPSGWMTTNFQVFNKNKIFKFSQSSKDEKLIEGEFINFFIFQTKYLIKISITLTEVERTPYIIHRDCEKISLKNECELVIIKHHGNETIIFDTREDALHFQIKLIERREGKR